MMPPGCLCSNDCVDPRRSNDLSIYASDGTCDDGGEGAAYSACELGTDCEDCGGHRCAPSPPPSYRSAGAANDTATTESTTALAAPSTGSGATESVHVKRRSAHCEL